MNKKPPSKTRGAAHTGIKGSGPRARLIMSSSSVRIVTPRGAPPTYSIDELYQTACEFSRYIGGFLKRYRDYMPGDTVDDVLGDFIVAMIKCDFLGRYDAGYQQAGKPPLFKGRLFRFLYLFMKGRRGKLSGEQRRTLGVRVELAARPRLSYRDTRAREHEVDVARTRVRLLKSRLPQEYGEVLDALLISNFDPAYAARFLGVERESVCDTLSKIRHEAVSAGIVPPRR